MSLIWNISCMIVIAEFFNISSYILSQIKIEMRFDMNLYTGDSHTDNCTNSSSDTTKGVSLWRNCSGIIFYMYGEPRVCVLHDGPSNGTF